jgi:hypothetical protein
MGTGDELYTKLGLNPERVAGYVYSGLFTSVVAAFLAPNAVRGLVDSLGGVLSTLAALALGIAVYVFYRQLIGEYFLYPLHHLLHGFLDSAFRRSGERLTSSTAFLAYLGVPFGHRRDAYTTIREIYLQEMTRTRLDLAHGELHVLYITACGCLVVVLCGLLSPGRDVGLVWIIGGIVSYLAALVGDIHQHSLETQMLKRIDRAELLEFLFKAGYVVDAKTST